MDINSVYDWSCKKLNTTIPRNEISDNLLEIVLRRADITIFNGKHLRYYSEDFQKLDSLEQWLNLLVTFYESIPKPHPMEHDFWGQIFILPNEKQCSELLSQYKSTRVYLYSIKTISQ